MRKLLMPVLAGLILTTASMQAGVITLSFEGIDSYPDGSSVLINNFYNGGTASNGVSGPNLGVAFSSGATLLCLNTVADQGCSNTSKGGLGVAGSQNFAMFFPSANPIMDVAAGFDTGFSLAYSNPSNNAATVGLQVWSGLDGTGSLLASLNLPGTGNGACPGFSGLYCPFVNASVGFAGVAKSVVFTGTADRSVYDDFTFGSQVVGGGTTPEPTTAALMGLALAGLGAWKLRRKA